MNKNSQKPAKPGVTIFSLLLPFAATGFLFFLTVVAGLSIAADPGNIDTGMAVVFCMPFYLIAALVGGVIIFLLIRQYGQHLSPTMLRERWRGWVLPLGTAVVIWLGIYGGVVSLMQRLAHDAETFYLPAVLSAPIWVALAFAVAAFGFRLVRRMVAPG